MGFFRRGCGLFFLYGRIQDARRNTSLHYCVSSEMLHNQRSGGHNSNDNEYTTLKINWTGTFLSNNRHSFLGMPTHWSNRSLAALLLCIHCVDNKPVISYFKHLSSDAEMGLAIEVLGNIFVMASEFISSNQTVISQQLASNNSRTLINVCLTYLKDNVGFNYRSVFNLIRNAINCGWGSDERRTMVQELWSDIREMCSTLLDDAVMIGKLSVEQNLNN